jgi:hypothetical protein
MARAQVNELRVALEGALASLKVFDDFRSPLNQAAAVTLYKSMPTGFVLKVAVREDRTGTFYRGEVTSMKADESSFAVLATDGDHVYGVTADMFVAVRMEPES